MIHAIFFGAFIGGAFTLNAALMITASAGWFALEAVACAQPARARYGK